jgi:hypothetical protein
MRDFTKTQKPSNSQQVKTGALKCNTCNIAVTAFGVQAGDPCRIPAEDGSGVCTGKFIKMNDAAADQHKRRTDGAA